MRFSLKIAFILFILFGLFFAGLNPASAKLNLNNRPSKMSTYLSLPSKSSLKKMVQHSKKNNLRRFSFAKIGDSNTEMAPNIYGLGCNLDTSFLPKEYFYLRSTLNNFQKRKYPDAWKYPADNCNLSNPFTRLSAATRSGTYTAWANAPLTNAPRDNTLGWDSFGWADPRCYRSETPLNCEIRLMKPRYVFIMTGTNDPAWVRFSRTSYGLDGYIQRLDKIIRKVKQKGAIPVLSTLPRTNRLEEVENMSFYEWIAKANSRLRAYAKTQRLPLIDLWAALGRPGVINQGLAADGLHLTSANKEDHLQGSVDFSNQGLGYGANTRNLLVLMMLRRLDLLN
jgi:hypothetical protein